MKIDKEGTVDIATGERHLQILKSDIEVSSKYAGLLMISNSMARSSEEATGVWLEPDDTRHQVSQSL